MIFVDASALVALMTQEPGWEALSDRLQAADRRRTSGMAVFETVAAVARKLSYSIEETRNMVADFLGLTDIQLMVIGETETDAALAAFEHFGKGRHPAALNMGDCFAYGCTKAIGADLLFKGDDFTRTDISQAT